MASQKSKYEIDRDSFSTALYIDGEYVDTALREDETLLLKEYITSPVILHTNKRTSKKEVVDGTGMLEAVQKASEQSYRINDPSL